MFENFLKHHLPPTSALLDLRVQNNRAIQNKYDFIIFETIEQLQDYTFNNDPVYIQISDQYPNCALASKNHTLHLNRVLHWNRHYFSFYRKINHFPNGLSLIIPCKDEAENIQKTFEQIPDFGVPTEVIFCDDQSIDTTVAEINKLTPRFRNQSIKLVTGPSQGKAKNVWSGFFAAENDILLIFDSDLTMPGQYLLDCYHAMKNEGCRFVNTTRLHKKLPSGAMKFGNLVGNHFFAFCFSLLLNQKITDTLSGTKGIWRQDFLRFWPAIGRTGIDDKWGDFELLFAAYSLGLSFKEIKVDYLPRQYGKSKMNRRFRNGLRMLGIILGQFFNQWKLKIVDIG